MNTPLVIAGIGTLVTAAIHILEGGRAVLAPMKRAPFDRVANRTMEVCWHVISANLVLSGIALPLIATVWESAAVGHFIAAHFISYAVLFIAVAKVSGITGAWLKLPQGTLFIPLAVLTWWGVL
jgi:hypothetical protein